MALSKFRRGQRGPRRLTSIRWQNRGSGHNSILSCCFGAASRFLLPLSILWLFVLSFFTYHRTFEPVEQGIEKKHAVAPTDGSGTNLRNMPAVPAPKTDMKLKQSEEQINYDSTSLEASDNNAPSLLPEITKEFDDNSTNHNITIQPKWIDHLKSLSDFPKIVHLIWPDKNILDSNFEMLEHGAKNLQHLNPDWKFIVHDYDDVHNTIQNFHHPDIPQSMHLDLANAHIVEKTDAFRLITIYEMGGLYVDIDRVMNRDIVDAIGDLTRTKLVLPTYYDINFANDLFGSSPKNELVLNVFRKQCKEREKFPRKNGWAKSEDQMSLVNMWTLSLESDLFGRKIEEAEWDEARDVLSHHSGGLIVTKKDMWCDGLLVADYDGCKQVSRSPLYDAYNVVRWVDQVDAIWANSSIPVVTPE